MTAVPGTAPPAPLGPHVRVENATAFVGWAAPPASLQLPIVSYRLELNSSAGNRTVLTTFPQATLTGLTRGAAYTARVAAANALGYGPRSASTYFVAFGAPAGALGLTLAYDPARSQLTLTWEPFAPSSVAPVDNLTIAWGSSNGSTGMARMGPTSTSWTLRGVAPGQTYTFGLWAGGPGGNGTPAEISRALPPTSPGSSSLFNEPLAILGEFLAFTFAIVLALAAGARGARPGAPNGRRRISSDQRGPSTGPAPAGGPAPGGSPTRPLPYPYVEAGSPRSSSDPRAHDPYGARLPRDPPAPILPAGRERPPRR